MNAYHREWSSRHVDEEREKLRKWRAENPDKRRAQYCRSDDARKRNDWAGALLKNTLYCARDNDRAHSLTREDIIRQYERQDGRCYYSGVKLDFNLIKHSPRYPSIDRVDSTRGYTPDNIVVASWWMNRAKFTYKREDFISLIEEMRAVSPSDLALARLEGPLVEQLPVASKDPSTKGRAA